MLLSFLSDQAKTDFTQGTRVKFVMVGPTRDCDPNEVVALILSGEETHAVEAMKLLKTHPGLVLVGGGKIEGADVWWESNTCEDEFCYDRPTEIGTQELLLQELTASLKTTNYQLKTSKKADSEENL
jgi:hypothetical protein